MTRSRLFPALVVTLGIAATAVALALPRGGQAAEPAHHHATTAAHSHAATVSEAAFAAEMRRLWFEHVEWTRFAIVAFAADAPNLDVTLHRLLRNQTDIGNAIKPFYGSAAGTKLTALLREHILIAVDILKAAKAGNKTALTKAQQRWNGNADRIASFLAAANPQSWPLAPVRAMLRAHLALTAKEAVAHLQGRWAADVRAADEVEQAMLHMADALSAGIVKQFPQRFES
jgi:hypothetical protein